MASPVEAIADSLDEQASAEDKGGGRLRSAIQGEFGEYDFDEAQLQVSRCLTLQSALQKCIAVCQWIMCSCRILPSQKVVRCSHCDAGKQESNWARLWAALQQQHLLNAHAL